MQRHKIIISYDGTMYAGWQAQAENISIQETIEKALLRLSGESIRVHGSGRTDKGVHARKQVAHFDIEKYFEEKQMARALNAVLPEDIRVLDSKKVPSSFNARKNVKKKEYRYFIWNREVMPPELRLYRTHIRTELNVGLMQAAADYLVGEHDFRSFCIARYPEESDYVREVLSLKVSRKGGEIVIGAISYGFLYKMVRSIAGYLIKVGKGRVAPCETKTVLKARKRTEHVETAPPQGLFLWHVSY